MLTQDSVTTLRDHVLVAQMIVKSSSAPEAVVPLPVFLKKTFNHLLTVRRLSWKVDDTRPSQG